jgi:RNA polymerase sigma factor (sigma-70 family)
LRHEANLSLDLFGDRLVLRGESGSDGERRKVLRALRKAVQGELTARQRDCLRLFYLEGENVTQIAGELGISAPVVSRHLKKARARLRRVMKYCMPRP